MIEDYDIGYDDGRMGLYLPGTRAGQYFERYVQGNKDGAESRAKRLLGNTEPHHLMPLDLPPTRPEPSRAEVAMRFMERVVPVMVQSGRVWSHDEVANTAVSCADALLAALDRKEASR